MCVRRERIMKRKSCFAGGSGIGIVNGLLGGGGGMLAVPILRKIGLAERDAHATAIAVILPVCIVSGAVYFLSGTVSLSLLVPVSLGVGLGGVLGAKLLNVLPLKVISFLFEGLMLTAGVKMLLS